MKILYAGGGTLGSVSPLIAIHQKLITNYKLQITDYKSLWLGTKNGPERTIVENEGIEFRSIISGKFRRYFDLKNLIDLFKIKIGFWQALFIILKFKPDIILTAGSFVAVPVAWAGWFCTVPVLAHQQDVRVGLANKLIAPVARKITVALDKSLQDFKKEKVILVGNPIRFACHSDRSGGISHINFVEEIHRLQSDFYQTFARDDNKENLPTVLVLGGGTGALTINELVWQSLEELTKFCNIIHITGKNKIMNNESGIMNYGENYKQFEFLNTEEIFAAIQVASMVISRAGMATLTELAYFKKPTIIIPIPNSHQEDNAKYFSEKNAALYLNQKELTSEKFVNMLRNLLTNEPKQKEIGEQMNKIFIDYSGEKFLSTILNEVKK